MRIGPLRLFLGLAALTWGVASLGIFMRWPAITSIMQGLGAKPMPYDPMIDYWLRMTAGAFTLIGLLHLLLLLQPRKYWDIIPWFGLLLFLEGVVLLVHGLRLSLPPLPFYADTAACLVGGAGIMWFSRRVY